MNITLPVTVLLGASLLYQGQGVSGEKVEALSKSNMCQAWQLCGDIHCLSTKLSDSFSSNVEDSQSNNPEDFAIINVADKVSANSS